MYGSTFSAIMFCGNIVSCKWSRIFWDLLHVLYRQFQMSYIFPFVKVDMFVGVIWDENIDICSSLDVVNSIGDVYVGVLTIF